MLTTNLLAMLELLPMETSNQILAANTSRQLISNLENFLGGNTMTLVIPDRDREQREDFIWCQPVIRKSWQKWYELSKQFKSVTPDGVRYMSRMEGRKIQTIMILPTSEQSDDDAMTACAWLRMVKGLTCRMYVIRCTDDLPSAAKTIMQAAGVDPALVEDIDDGNPTNTQDTCSES